MTTVRDLFFEKRQAPPRIDQRWADELEHRVHATVLRISDYLTRQATAAAQAAAAAFTELTPETFGVIPGLGVSDIVAARNSAGMNLAIAAASSSGKPLVCRAQYYVFGKKLTVLTGAHIQGEGVGFWDAVFHSRAKTWDGTNFLFKGTGATDESMYGITSMPEAGGAREDPDNPGEYFTLTSFMNSDASGTTRATPRTFSCAMQFERHASMSGVRVVPWDDIDNYSDESSSSLGDDWDVGVMIADGEYVDFDTVQVVGYWRLAGLALLSTGFDSFGQCERNIFKRCKFQGWRGVLIRSGDVWVVQATTSSTLSIYWNDEHYWPTSGTFNGIAGGTYTYTGLSYSAPNLTFTGVTPDPSSAGETRVRNPNWGSGFAGTEFHDCMIHALDHVSGDDAETLGFSLHSTALEVSGFPMRGVQMFGTRVQTVQDDVAAFFHDAVDFQFVGGQIDTGSNIFLIASPSEGTSVANAPSGYTWNMRLVSTLIGAEVDTRLFTPRTIQDDFRQFNPKNRISSNLLIEALSGQQFELRIASGTNFYLVKSDGTRMVRFSDSGNLFPNTDNTVALGTSSNRWNTFFTYTLSAKGGSTLADSTGTNVVEVASNGNLGFYAASPIAQPTVTGSKGGNAALASLMTALSNLGLVIDSTT